MLSKLVSRYAKQQTLVNMAHRGFRASAIANKKPSIGDAVTILQSKVSSINQVVSIHQAPRGRLKVEARRVQSDGNNL